MSVSPPDFATVRTTCPYCGVGCGVRAQPDGRGGAIISGDPDHPANVGRLCSKGSALGETLSLDGRLLRPEIDGIPVPWHVAIGTVAERLAETIRDHGPDSVALYVSGQLLTEDYYVANKLCKGFLGTANIDTNSRLCMASSVAGHRRAFGADTVPGTYEDLELADLVVLVGSNLAWCHPVLFQRLVAARRARPGMKLVVIDPRRTATADEADLFLPVRPGTDVALFNGLLAHLGRTGRRAARFLDRFTSGEKAALLAGASAGTSVDVARACGLEPRDVARFYDWFAAHERTVTVYSQGVNQSSAGTDKVNAIINCHLYTGRIGRPGMGPFSVTGQPNAMGGREVGALANQLAAHMDFSPREIDRVRRFWQAPTIATRPGLKAVDLFHAVEAGKVRAVWVMATNPAVSLPDAGQVRRALEQCPLVIVSDCVRHTDTADRADILLPALGWGEKEGTVTNSERRISRQRAFLPPPGEAKPDWWIISAVGRRLGFPEAFAYTKPAEIFREHAALSAFENGGSRDFDIGALATLSDAEYDALTPTQWPFPAGAAAPRERFFADGRFYHSDQRAKLFAVAARPTAYVPDPESPLVLNTGRVRDQWHTMTRTGRAPRLTQHAPEPYLAIHPIDAGRIGLRNGMLARIESHWGRTVARVQVTEAQRPGEVFAPMHWNEQFGPQGAINVVVNPAVDPVSGQPELKHTPVRVTPVATRWFGFALARHPVALGDACFWTVAVGDAHRRYELAGDGDVESLFAAFAPPGPADVLELRDAKGGVHRWAWLVDGRIASCIFVAPTPELPARAWLAGLFAAEALTAAQRASLLAGRAADGPIESGPIVCACFGVGRDAIGRAIAGGARSTEAIGAAVKAGTNCGSCLPELAKLIVGAHPTAA